jgi:hypothetical protein
MIDETRLENLAKQLGARAAERLNVQATAQQIVARLREQPVERRPFWIQQTWLRIAAALVLVVGGSAIGLQLLPRHGSVAGVNAHPAHLIADDLNDLTADQLRDVLSSMDQIVSTDSVVAPENNDLHELNAQQLRAMLRSLEG